MNFLGFVWFGCLVVSEVKTIVSHLLHFSFQNQFVLYYLKKDVTTLINFESLEAHFLTFPVPTKPVILASILAI